MVFSAFLSPFARRRTFRPRESVISQYRLSADELQESGESIYNSVPCHYNHNQNCDPVPGGVP